MPELPPLYDDLAFLSPLSDERAASLVGFIADANPETVLDIGCGWGELLLRTLAALPDARGLGLDLEPQRLEEARRRAEARCLGERASFEARDARRFAGMFDAVVCIGATQVWGPPVDAAQPLDYAAALVALRGLIRPGGRLVYGGAVWSGAPTAAATSALSGRDDEYLPVEAVASLAQEQGFTVSRVEVADLDEWDHFESGFTGRLTRWLERHPADHEDAAAVREQLRDQRGRYLDGYRGVLGMAYLNLVAG
jgi:cyclopropane fatty-acyl-phospholipid synthase-like methyltransferase